MSFLKWLTDNRLGTHLFTRRRGERVGEDAQGNVYYRRGGAADLREERPRGGYGRDGELQARSWICQRKSGAQQASSAAGTVDGSPQRTPLALQIQPLQRQLGFSTSRT